MFGYLKRLVTTGAAYQAAEIVAKGIAVITLPLYTGHASAKAYGAYNLLLTTRTRRRRMEEEQRRRSMQNEPRRRRQMGLFQRMEPQKQKPFASVVSRNFP